VEPPKLSLLRLTYSGLGQLFTWLSILLIPTTDLLTRHYFDQPAELRSFRADLTLIAVMVVATLAAIRQGLVQRENRRLFGALTRSESKYKFLVEASHDFIYRLNARGEWEFVNDVCQQLFGHSKKEMLGRHLTEFVHPEDRAAALEIYQQVKRGRNIRSYENRIVCKDGTVLYMSWNCSPIHDPEGRFIGCHGMSRDVTLTRRLQDELNQKAQNLEKAYAELQATQQHLLQSERLAAVGQLVSGIAHELNNPLTAVLGFSEMLLNDPGVDRSARNKLNKVFDAAKRTQNIVNNLLRFARQEKPSRQPVDIKELLERTVALREYDLRVSNVKVELRQEAEVPLTLGDPHQLCQVFLNIINNAYDALVESGREGHLVISTKCLDKWIEIEFVDDGPGIREPARVFEPFYTTKDIGHGTGLGLSICYGIVKEHGGEILARNHAGQGATFTVRLPLVPVPALANAVPPATSAQKPGARTALVVDDEESVVELQRHILEELGVEVSAARDGKEALACLAAGSFDVVILDLKMPGGVSGREVYHWLKENRPGKEKTVLFVTGDVVSHETALFLSQAGIQALTKPFALDDYRKAIAKVLVPQGPPVVIPLKPNRA
jgi:two-component system NtrC family sensor kinase